jgi:hypothetical protein
MSELIEELESEEEELKRDDHMSTVLWGRLDLLRLITKCKEALQQSQWVSVEDRLPELHKRVSIATTDYDGDPVTSIAHWNGDAGFLVVNGQKDPDVTHWMPLPTPPAKEQGS